MSTKDYYQILGIAKTATKEQIKQAYRKLAMQYHPDRNPGKEKWANEKFKEINEAFSVLGNPEKRNQYDQFGTAGNIGDIFGNSATRTTFEDLMKDFSGAGLKFDFLDTIFDDTLKRKGFSFKTFSFGGPGGMRFQTSSGVNLNEIFAQAQYPSHQDVQYEIKITQEQAALGFEKDLVRKGKKLRVTIPAGIKSGTKLRQTGDIVILITVE
jgi:curved DNA-binding protein